MTDNLPRLSKKNTTIAQRVLVVAKLLRDQIADSDKKARAYLAEKAMNPGDRANVIDDSGESIGTISLSKPRKRGGLVITDPMALAAWCDAHNIQHGGKPSIEFPAWFTAQANLQALVHMSGGELPDGLDDTTEEGAPALSVRMSDDQRAQLLSNFQTPRALLEAARLIDEEETGDEH